MNRLRSFESSRLTAFPLGGHYLESGTLINGIEVSATWARGRQGFIIVGKLVVVLNCGLHVFVGVRFCIKGRRVVFTTGHLQVPCAVERLIGYVVDGFALLGMFCPQKGVDPPAELYNSECFVRRCAFGFFQCTCRIDPPVEMHSSGCFVMKSVILMAFCVKGRPDIVALACCLRCRFPWSASQSDDSSFRTLGATTQKLRCRVVEHFIRGMK